MKKDFKEITGIKIGDKVLLKGQEWFDRNFVEGAGCIQNLWNGDRNELIVTKAHLNILGTVVQIMNVDESAGSVTISRYPDGKAWELPTWLIESVA